MNATMRHQLQMSLARVEGAMSTVMCAIASLPTGTVLELRPEAVALRSQLIQLRTDLKKLAELYESMIAEDAPMPLDLSKLKEMQEALAPQFQQLKQLRL